MMVVRLDNAAVAVAVMDVVLIQIIVAHRANFLKRDYSTVTDLLFYQSFCILKASKESELFPWLYKDKKTNDIKFNKAWAEKKYKK